jgi:LacI family transcriptional regulator
VGKPDEVDRKQGAMSAVRPVTIRDVARVAGVSLSTVSQVLNGRLGYASADTRDRVLTAARELNYRPNALARGLVTSRTGTLGLVITDITRTLFPKVVAGIEQVASQQGYSVLLTCAGSVEIERTAVETLVDKRADGIIFMSNTTEFESDHIITLARQRVPIVTINRPLDTTELSQIVWDDVEVGRRSTEHLIALGHRRIAHLAGTLTPPRRLSAVNRLQGFRDAMADAGLAVDERLIIDADFQHDGGFTAASQLLDLDDPPTAVFAASDSMAVGFVNGLHRRRVRVPDDISVAGANDDASAVYVEPPLTTVRVPVAAAGRRAAEIILAAIGSRTTPTPVCETLGLELVVRHSTQRLDSHGRLC